MATASPPVLNWMNALADATRVRLLRVLEQHELTVAELCSVVQLPQSTVSRHLKVLADEGWAASRREATSRLYRMATEGAAMEGRRLWQLLREQFDATASARQDDRRLQSVLADRRTRSQAFFDTAAGQWDKLRTELFGGRFDLLGLLALLEEQWVVGDLGCGTGQTAELLSPHVKRIIAVDESALMLRHAKQRLKGAGNVDLRRGSLDVLPIEDAELDAAVLCMVLHHLPDPPAALREARRVLKPTGRLLIIDMFAHDRDEYQQQMGHIWLGFEPKQLTGWLKEAGLNQLRIAPLPHETDARGPATFAAVAKI